MKKKRRFGRRVFCVLIVLFMGVIWQSDLLSQEPAEVRSLRKHEAGTGFVDVREITMLDIMAVHPVSQHRRRAILSS